jgi:hypothetical protein
MTYELSIVIPSIRIDNWKDIIDSIYKSCKNYKYEIIFIGPELNNNIKLPINVKFIRDFSSPNRCQQSGALLSSAKYIHFGSDDCLYIEDSIDQVMNILFDTDKIISCNYTEGGNAQKTLNFIDAYGNNKFNEIQDHWKYINVPFMLRETFLKFNFNCAYSTTCWGHANLAARIQSNDFEIEEYKLPIFNCSHMPNITGDHAPIHYAFYNDQNIFYNSSILEHIKDYYNSSDFWEKRFIKQDIQ